MNDTLSTVFTYIVGILVGWYVRADYAESKLEWDKKEKKKNG